MNQVRFLLLALLVATTGSSVSGQDDIRGEIQGLGLVQVPGVSRTITEIRPHPVMDHPGGSVKTDGDGLISKKVTKRQCSLLCASHFDCQSYSTCGQGNYIECTLSKASLANEELVAKLLEFRRDATTQDGKDGLISLNNQQGKLAVRRDDSCTLTGKSYVDYFNSIDERLQDFGVSVLLPVVNENQCAQYCAQRNFRAHADNLRRIKQTIDSIGGNGAGVVQSANYLHCESYDYIDLIDVIDENVKQQLVQISRESIQVEMEADEKLNVILKENRGKPIGGYCKMSQSSLKSYESPKELSVPARHNTFKFELFFNRTDGVVLEDTPKSGSLSRVMSELSLGNAPTDSELGQQVLAFIKRGDNNQRPTWDDVETCASLCFRQFFWSVWPACRSFDMIKKQTSEGLKITCHLNTVSLAQAQALNRTDLIYYAGFRSGFESSHYDLHAGLDMDLESFF